MSTADISVRANGTAAGFSDEQLDLITRTVAQGATQDELQLFLYTAASRGLDPLLKQVHAVKRFDKRQNRETMAIQVGIDGYRLLADRTGHYAGNDDPTFGSLNAEGHPTTATVTVWKLVEGTRCPFTATARWAEYAPGGSQAFMWARMPHLMLSKCAEALALRKAFPAELGGLYIPEEMHQAGSPSPIATSDTAPAVRRDDGTLHEVTPSTKNEPPAQQGDPERAALLAEWYALMAQGRSLGIEPKRTLPDDAPLTTIRRWIDLTKDRIKDAQQRQPVAEQAPITDDAF